MSNFISISPVKDDRHKISVMWNPEFLASLGEVDKSPLKKMLVVNDRHAGTNAKSTMKNGTTTLYPNLGIGQMTSCMVEWGSTHGSVREMKGYCSTSNIWRNNAPYEDTCYSVAALPLSPMLSNSDIDESTTKSLMDR